MSSIRRRSLVAMLILVLGAFFAPARVALAEDYPDCTIPGTAEGETLTGTEGDDVICTGGGNDTVNALGGERHLRWKCCREGHRGRR